LIELAPIYCDVIVKRREEFTEKTLLQEDGKAFDDIARQRITV
jgi:hypothetical protein